MSDAVGSRWRRWGHDRLYVRSPGGDLVGYWDLKTGTAVLEPGADRAALDAALAHHHATIGSPPAAPVPVALRERVLVPPPQTRTPLDDALPTKAPAEPVRAPAPAGLPAPVAPWVDLAGNRPGAAARARAVQLRRAAPVRTILDRLLGRRTDERAWRIGADGEEAVAAELAGLGGRWRVLHAVPVGDRGCDIDHVVIGPAGVFTVNTKTHPDAGVWVAGNAFRVNYRPTDYVHKSRREARRAAKLLTAAAPGIGTVAATGVIAVVGARQLVVKRQPEDVAVVARRDIRAWLQRQPVRLDTTQVDALYEVARRSSTWQPPARPAPR